MSDIEHVQRGLLGTDNPEVWAEEFCRIFQGYVIEREDDPNAGPAPDYVKLPVVDTGTMATWFRAAMEAASKVGAARKARITAATENVPEAAREGFLEGFDEGRQPEPT